MKNVSTLLLFVFMFLVASHSFAFDILTKNLSFGMSDPEVVILQQKLNQDPDTVVATSGAGSAGNESSYFGSKTRGAVVKFQNKYPDEILVPAGLESGNGFVGLLTRAVLNKLAENTVSTTGSVQVSSQNPTTTNILTISDADRYKNKSAGVVDTKKTETIKTASPYFDNLVTRVMEQAKSLGYPMKLSDVEQAYSFASSSSFVGTSFNANDYVNMASSSAGLVAGLEKSFGDIAHTITPSSKVILTELSRTTAEPGDSLRIYGKGFGQADNTVLFNDQKITGATSTALGVTIDTTIPKDIFGPVRVSVESQGERSFPLGLMVAKKNTNPPSIYVSQKSANLKDEITIRAVNLTDKNDVYTSFGKIDNATLVGTSTLVVKMIDIVGFSVYKDLPQQFVTTVPVYLWIINANGVSNQVGPINVEL